MGLAALNAGGIILFEKSCLRKRWIGDVNHGKFLGLSESGKQG
jgi:hypothetical protein